MWIMTGRDIGTPAQSWAELDKYPGKGTGAVSLHRCRLSACPLHALRQCSLYQSSQGRGNIQET